jgi:DNA-binding transcriptional LysR family regulator
MYYNLLHLKKVVESGSISKAGRLLYISQPALSKSIKLLEEHFGVKILERHSSGVRTTAYGDILYRTASEMERCFLNSQQEILEKKLLHQPEQNYREIHIGCSTIWNDFLLPEVMKSIDKVDSYGITIKNDTSEQLLTDLLEKDEYDFVLCRILEEKKFHDLNFIPLFKSQPAVFIDEHHPIFSTGFKKEKLQDLKWIKLKSLPVLRRSDLTAAGLSFLPENFFSPAISFEVEDLMAAIQLLRNNYIMHLPLSLAGLLEKYHIKPLPFPKTLTNAYWLGMAHLRDKEIPDYIKEFMSRIRLFFTGNSLFY